MRKLHGGQVEIRLETVKALIEEQFPQYKSLPLYEFDSTGTVNAIFRLGNDYYVRLPVVKRYEASLLNEHRILPYLGEKLSLEIPRPVHLGVPGAVYPFHWGIYNWIDGDSYDAAPLTDFRGIVSGLANFVKELHSIRLLDDAPGAGRKPLADLNAATLEALAASKDEIDHKKAAARWETLITTPAWDKRPVWIHADLLKPNIVIKNNHIAGIIDFGSAGAGDPAFDIIPAWSVFGAKDRAAFREKLEVEDAVWYRACAYALHQAALIIPYYRGVNEKFVSLAVDTINEITKGGL